MASNVRQTYQQASFGGLDFDFISTSDQRGNRLAAHEYPERDVPFVEGLGRKLRVFRITGAVRGDDHVRRSSELIEKCECGDVQTLVHPLYGEYEVKCSSVTVENDYLRARETVLSFEFYEAGEFIFPQLAAQAGLATQSGLVGYTGAVFNGVSLGDATNDALFLFVQGLATELRRSFTRNIVWNDASVDIDGLLLQMESTPAQFTGDAFSIVARRAVEGIYAQATSPDAAASALCELMDYGLGEGQPIEAYALQFRLMVIGWAAAAALDAGYTNPSQALSFMECVIGKLERDGELAASLCFDDVYSQTLGMISSVSRDFRTVAVGLPPVLTRALCSSLPSLVAAYEVFGNIDTLDDFTSLNARGHSFSMPKDVLYQAQ